MPRLNALHRWLHVAACVLVLAALGGYAVSLAADAVLVQRFGGRPRLFSGWDMLVSAQHPYGATPIEIGLWSLNAIVLAWPLLWGMRPQRRWVLAPIVAWCGAFWWWAATPSTDLELALASVVWEVQAGYYLWLGSIAAIVVAVTLRWTARVLAGRAWMNRNRASNAHLGVDPAAIAHLSPSLRAIIVEAADLRRLLDVAAQDERVQSMLWDWVMRLRRLPDVDAAELERLRVPTHSVHAAVEPLWLTEGALRRADLLRVDAALAAFLTAVTSGGRATAFR